MIEVSGITKEFGRFTAVQDLSFSVAKGEVLGFLGPNGAGKTTTMRILTGFLPATRGTAVVAGHDILSQPLEAKRKVGYLPESPPLYPEMTVFDYLEFVARIKGVPRERRKTRVEESLERCALKDVRDKMTGKLSKGYRQRVGLAQALVHEPEVLILDEPTAGLDPKQIHETRSLIRSLGGDHTVVLSTHILPEVVMTCDRVVIINKGAVVAQGTTESLIEEFRAAERLQVVVEGPEPEVLAVVRAQAGVIAAEPVRSEGHRVTYQLSVATGADVRRALAERLVKAGYGLWGLHQEGTTLEEVYLRVVSSEEVGEAAR
ncbi:MAG TPA: ABC transporter ATP-binding protein [Vicinamibacteria bacterium]|nr:ABC transporter ATP-binding protein [Vicinamibacteria bacterium]